MTPYPIHEISASVLSLEMRRDEANKSAFATGFLWRVRDQLFIITNRHNVTGRNTDTGEPLCEKTCWFPKTLCVRNFRFKHGQYKETGYFSRKAEIVFDLYDKEEIPRWLSLRAFPKFDCVALPIDLDEGEPLLSRPINELSLDDTLVAEVGMDCFAVGFPMNLAGTFETPIWKRASIATEPSLPYKGEPVILIDTATKQGMSGSPVFVRYTGVRRRNGEFESFGESTNFLGIYSGRFGDDEFGVQLGRVWKRDLIDDLIENGARISIDDSYEFY